jgi:hypothetical protein
MISALIWLMIHLGVNDIGKPIVFCKLTRSRTYREDMGGVGSFTRDNRTLYIEGIRKTANMDEVVTRHFAEWGEMEYGLNFAYLLGSSL